MTVKQTTGAAIALLLLTSGCSSQESAPDTNAESSTTHSTEATTTAETDSPKPPTKLKGAVDIEGAYMDGKLSSSVGPVYRLKSGVAVLALTSKVSPEITRYPATTSIAQAIVSPDFNPPPGYSGIYLLDDTEVFEPITDDDGKSLWQPQDPALDKLYMHPYEERKKGGISESVLIPFAKIDDSDHVGIAVGEVGFAGNVPVFPISDAPDNIQEVAKKMEPLMNANESTHSPYTEVVESPGLDVASGKESLEVTLAADVFFDSGSWELKPESNQALDQLVQALTTHEPGEVDIVGHTDDVPDNNIGNQALSENRANAVKAALEQRPELKGFNFIASGKGESEPANPGHDEEARAQNRRVNIIAKTPVTREVLKVRAEHGPLPAPAGTEATWPDSVEYVPSTSPGKDPSPIDFSASKAIAYPNYTVVTYTITAKTKTTLWGRLKLDSYPDYWSASLEIFSFFGADIARGETRTLPLKYERQDLERIKPRFVIAGSAAAVSYPWQKNDRLTIPVVYPPTSDKTITLDVRQTEQFSHLPVNGWRIKDVPVVPAQDEK